MQRRVSSTELQLHTRKVIRDVLSTPTQPVIVYNYNDPQVVMVSYEAWQAAGMEKGKPKLAELKKYFVKSSMQIDSSAQIRKMRDDE